MAKRALDDRATAARLEDHDAKNEDHDAKTDPALVTDRMADALPRDGKPSSAGVSNQRFSRDPRPKPSIATKDTSAMKGDRSVAPLPPDGPRALAMSATEGDRPVAPLPLEGSRALAMDTLTKTSPTSLGKKRGEERGPTNLPPILPPKPKKGGAWAPPPGSPPQMPPQNRH